MKIQNIQIQKISLNTHNTLIIKLNIKNEQAKVQNSEINQKFAIGGSFKKSSVYCTQYFSTILERNFFF